MSILEKHIKNRSRKGIRTMEIHQCALHKATGPCNSHLAMLIRIFSASPIAPARRRSAMLVELMSWKS